MVVGGVLEMLGSRGVSVNEIRPRVLWHRVTHFTVCPLGSPEIAIGHEPRIEPGLPAKQPARLPLFRTRWHCHHQQRNPYENGQPAKLLHGCETTVGWISRKNLGLRSRRSFFLTSLPRNKLFIELIDPVISAVMSLSELASAFVEVPDGRVFDAANLRKDWMAACAASGLGRKQCVSKMCKAFPLKMGKDQAPR